MEVANNSFLDHVEKIGSLLIDSKDTVGEVVCEPLDRIYREMPRLYNEVMNENRDLKLGIVGRVKAGKSSFLNALLFNGEEWLPKAATPMTAALTRITHTEDKPQMVVHYYLREEWERWINETRSKAKEISDEVNEEINRRLSKPLRYQMPQDQQGIATLKAQLVKDIWEKQPMHVRAAEELTRMAGSMTHNKLPGKYKDSTSNEKIDVVDIDVTDPEKLRASIHKYVGAGGEYTPFVSYIELRLNDERLRGLQIVDTPGLDDPVASRVVVTDDFLKECDAALLLSSVSHFLGAGDASLIKDKMQNVARAYIIGTMMDAGVLEYSDRRADLQNSYSNSRDNYTRHAREFLEDLQKTSALPADMSVDDEPEFVSSMFYCIAQKMKSNPKGIMNDIEKHIIGLFQQRFKDFHNVLGTHEDFENFGAIDSIYERVYAPIKSEKEELKRQRISKFVSSQAVSIVKELEYIRQALNNKIEEIQSTDVAEVRSRMEQLDRAINDSRADIIRVFDNMEQRVGTLLNFTINNINSAMLEYDTVDERTEIESYVEVRKKLIILKDYVPQTRHVRVASTPKTATQIGKFVNNAKSLFENNVIKIIDANNTSMEIINILQKAFKMVAYTPPKGKIESVAMSLVKKLQKPSIDFGMESIARNALLSKFPGQVQGNSVDDLHAELGTQLRSVNKDITRQINEKRDEIIKDLQMASITFSDNLKKDLNEHYETLEKELSSKKESLIRLDDLIQRTDGLKNIFMTVAGN